VNEFQNAIVQIDKNHKNALGKCAKRCNITHAAVNKKD
jgi:hypothetical protein